MARARWQALQPLLKEKGELLARAARAHPATVAPLAVSAGSYYGLWRIARSLRLSERSYALMNCFLAKAALTIAACVALMDAEDCQTGTHCRALLDGECPVDPEDELW